jgi:hypothetical protein
MRVLLTIIAAILLASPAFGAANDTHGQDCDDDIKTDVIIKGEYKMGCINICNNYAAADTDPFCTIHEFVGLPDIIILEKEDNGTGGTECQADATFTITTGPTAAGPKYPLDTSAVVLNDATERIVFPQANGPFNTFLFIDVTSDTGCTDVDVRMYTVTKH